MDKQTFIQFLIVSSVILVAWWTVSYFVYGRRAAERRAAEPQRHVERVAPPPAPEQEPVRPDVAQPPPAPEPEPVEIVLENGTIRTEWTNRGAALKRLTVLDERYKAPYTEGDERPPLTLLRDFEEGTYSDTVQSVTFTERGGGDAGAQHYQLATADLMYEVIDQSPARLAFEAVALDERGHALKIRKTVTVEPEDYHYSVALEFTNASPMEYDFACAVRGPAGIGREVIEPLYRGTRIGKREGANKYDISKFSLGDLKKGPQTDSSANIAWAAVVNHYFAAVLMPENMGWVDTIVSKSITETDILARQGRWGLGTVRNESDRASLARQNAAVIVNTDPVALEPDGSLTERYRIITVPKKDEMLDRYDAGLSGLVEFGWFPTLSRLALALLKAIHRLLPNYGVAILVLTAIIRTILHPLTRKSQLSMSRMQKLQPMIQELQNRYKDDKQKVTHGQLELFRKYGVSPMSGCWPLFLQMPVLFALFGALRAAIELRHAGFLWVDDLSRPDTLFHFPFYLPLLGNAFNLLPLLVVVMMIVNQRFTPKPASEQARQQQKMMKFMPAVLGLLFYRMPSGLCLYFTASMGAGALERWLIDKKAAKIELKPIADGERKEKRRGGTSRKPEKRSWLERLQDRMEQQHKASGQARRRKEKK